MRFLIKYGVPNIQVIATEKVLFSNSQTNQNIIYVDYFWDPVILLALTNFSKAALDYE